MRNLRFLVLTLLSISFITNYAQTALDQVLVSASRIQSKKFESGKNITVISQKEIAQLPVNSVDELLQYVGGVNINNRGGFGVQSDVRAHTRAVMRMQTHANARAELVHTHMHTHTHTHIHMPMHKHMHEHIQIHI